MAVTKKAELEALHEENQELHRQLAMIEAKCKRVITFGWKPKQFAISILKIMGVENHV